MTPNSAQTHGPARPLISGQRAMAQHSIFYVAHSKFRGTSGPSEDCSELVLEVETRRCAGRPAVSAEIRKLIREMSIANPLWGAPRIHGELLKLGIDVGQSSVAKYKARRRRPPSQGWKTFPRNHADGIVAMDLFVVPTVSFRLLYALLIMGHCRRRIVWLGVTAHPSAEWLANQLTQAFGWEQVAYSFGAFSVWASAITRPQRVRVGKTLCGVPDRLDPPGVPRPCRRAQRAPPAPSAVVIYGILQRGSYASLAGQGTPLFCDLFTQSGGYTPSPFSADCIISTFGFDLR